MVSAAVSFRNGDLPDSISYSTHPNEKMSVRWSTGSPRTCSGDMYPAVPSKAPVAVDGSGGSVGAWGLGSGRVSLATPKSRILTCPSLVTNTLAGLRSRWMIPFSCAAARPCAIWTAVSTALRTARPPFLSRSRRVSPSSSSETMYETVTGGSPGGTRLPPSRAGAGPAATPTSNTARMLGWLSAATARASRSNRRNRSGSVASSGGKTLIATSRPSRGSWAR